MLQPSAEGKLVPEAYVLPFTVQDSGRSKERGKKDHKIIHYNDLLGTGDGEGVVTVGARKMYYNSNNIVI